MKNDRIIKVEAVAFVLVLICATLLVPYFSTSSTSKIIKIKSKRLAIRNQELSNSRNRFIANYPPTENENKSILLDTVYVPEEEIETTLLTDQNDIGYNIDAGDRILKALPIYVGEPIDQTVPGRGRIGSLDPDNRDTEDWYYFSVCEGQTIEVSISSSEDYDIEIVDYEANPVGKSYTADVTGNYYIHIFANEGAGAGDYSLTVNLIGQNDAGTGKDAGNSINQATPISPGSYYGYMSVDDQEDWYSFDVNSGQGIFVDVTPLEKSDYDIHLYNPSGEEVYYASYYGEDHLEYPADVSGTWKIKIDMFPGWDQSKWPSNYFLYGSGAYELKLSIGGTAKAPPGPIPQPDITPVAQTFIVNDDPTSNKDEYAYIAAIPAANYIEGGKRYLSPIVYQGVDLIPTWFTTVDQTTQYLLDDWNTYLARHGVTAKEYTLPSDPVKAASYIAITKWTSSDTAVVAVDGSEFEDEITTIIDEDKVLSSPPVITRFPPDSPKFKEVGGNLGVPMFIGSKWGAIHLIALGDRFRGDTGIITPRYEGIMEDWWPSPYDLAGPDYDTFFPIVLPGLWIPYITDASGLEELQVIKYAGDRYKIPVTTTDCSIKVTITTDEPSNLIVYLIDPYGNVRRPSIPHYNGGEINPIHIWNGGHWQHNFDEFRTWIIEPHTQFSVEVNHPMTGKWTAIVVPYLDKEEGDIGFSGEYHITAEIRYHNSKRIAAGLSAANAAVIASLKHIPLLYVEEDSVPSETSDALSQLGVSNIIFVNINGVSTASLPGSVTEYKTMQKVVDAIKADANSENFITVTSFATGDGYFAPAAMAAAYHGSPVLNIGEAAGAYDTLDKARSWIEYGGDYYHGARSLGHLPHMDKPFNLLEAIKDFLTEGALPPLGFDLQKRWFSAIHNGIYGNLTAKYGLDLPGKEAYLFVANRDTDIRDLVVRVMMGNNSYAGHIPVPTAAFASDVICRDILYPAIIFANPGRDITTSQLMNFPDGWTWTTNDRKSHAVYSSREMKRSFSSHGRFYEGHCVWDNLLERFNKGASVWYYSGHGTGGSGISAQYRNVAEQFPYAELTHEHLKNFNWWDGWRGYMYDDKQTKTPRWGGFTWYNPREPNLYDIIHFKWADQLFGNLHSIFDLWMSCTTQAHLGPIVFLSHGAALCYGNIGTGLCPHSDLFDDWWMHDVFVNGDSVGEAFSRYIWLFQRDYTTGDPTAMYGSSSLAGEGCQVVFGDPTLTCYSPEWTEPVPISP
jgi:hypothetical protein